MKDLTYINQGLFCAFIPNTQAGETAWRELAEHTDGTGKVLMMHKQSTITQLRMAGYTVGKEQKVKAMTTDDADRMMLELGID